MNTKKKVVFELKNQTPEKQNDFGMTLISAYKMLPVESMKFNREYQRATEPARKEAVKESILECGQYLSDKPVIVNQFGEAVDGQHRILAAIELEIEKIPATIYHFSDKKLEAAFFVHVNGYNSKLNPLNFWWGMFLSGDPIAVFMYRLESDRSSALYQRIAVKGHADLKARVSPSMALEIIIHGMGLVDNWDQKRHRMLLKTFLDIGQEAVFFNVNTFFKWFQEIFGTKKGNPSAYRTDSMRAALLLHRRLCQHGIAYQKTTIQKMKTFSMDVTFVTAPLAGKKYQLIDHFNKNRKKDRIPYNLEK